MGKAVVGNTRERLDGPTPNGGVYAIAFFFDKAGNPTTKDKAVRIEICEYNERDECIFRTHGRLSSKEWNN